MTSLLYRGAAPLVGLERTRNVRRRFRDRRLSATSGLWSQSPSDWLRGRTLYGSVRRGNGLWTQLGTDSTPMKQEQLFRVRQTENNEFVN